MIATYAAIIAMRYPGAPTQIVLGALLFGAFGQFFAQGETKPLFYLSMVLTYFAGLLLVFSWLRITAF